jgi:hypothetical protein
LGRAHGYERLQVAVEAALAVGCHDRAAIEHLLLSPSLSRPTAAPLDVGALRQFERPLPSVASYDQLLVGAGAS